MNLICLVSRQAMPNLLPVLMFKPKSVFLLSTREELDCGRHLQSLLSKKGIKVNLYDDILAYDDAVLNRRLDHICDNISDLYLNITGGTKPMAITAYEKFRERNLPIFYCNTEHKEIIHFLPERKKEPITADLTIHDYILAYGYTIKDEKPGNPGFDYLELFSFLSNNNLYGEFLTLLQKMRQVDEKRINFTVHSKQKIFSFQKSSTGMYLKASKNGSEIRKKYFNTNFLMGDWLEYYIYWMFTQTHQPDEIKIGVKILSESGVRNEVDILMLKDYMLYLCSCKSGKFGNDTLYELETLRIITSGTYGKGIAVFTSRAPESIVKRAAELKIKVIDDLQTMPSL